MGGKAETVEEGPRSLSSSRVLTGSAGDIVEESCFDEESGLGSGSRRETIVCFLLLFLWFLLLVFAKRKKDFGKSCGDVTSPFLAGEGDVAGVSEMRRFDWLKGESLAAVLLDVRHGIHKQLIYVY